MSKLPKVKKVTWKELIPFKWMVWACEANDVHHLILRNEQTIWMNTAGIDDCRDVIVFKSLKKAKEFIRKCVKRKLLPTGVKNIEYAKVVPTFEDGKLWYDVYDEKTGLAKYTNKCEEEAV
jgi:hypothetical protein